MVGLLQHKVCHVKVAVVVGQCDGVLERLTSLLLFDVENINATVFGVVVELYLVVRIHETVEDVEELHDPASMGDN